MSLQAKLAFGLLYLLLFGTSASTDEDDKDAIFERLANAEGDLVTLKKKGSRRACGGSGRARLLPSREPAKNSV